MPRRRKAKPVPLERTSATPKYVLTVDLNALKHLGFNLYSNIPAVISEAIANCWDADALHVDIDLDVKKQSITIVDDGFGMDEADINRKYLTVGYRKRDASAVTPRKRHVMGRKGIGKLSLFSIADTIEVHSRKKRGGTAEKNGFVMRASAIEKQIKDGKGSYAPTVVPPSRIKISKGTRIKISKLKKRITAATLGGLRTRLARRFSVIGPDFRVSINGKAISVSDRNYFKSIQYLWTLGKDATRYADQCVNAEHSEHLDGAINKKKRYEVSGWIGTFDEQKSMSEGDNSIVVLAWGKLIHEDLLNDIKKGGIFTKYLIGEIRADFLDTDGEPDIATSDRQSLKEDDPRFEQLKNFVRTTILNKIESRWSEWRGEDAEKKALGNPAIKKWFDTLKGDNRKYARQLFAKIESFPIEDQNYKKELYRHGILAFEKLALGNNLSLLDSLSTNKELDLLGSVFSGIDDLEAAEYHQIVKGRLEVIKKFAKLAPKARERVVQSYLFDHLWLLHPSWERASTNPHVEEAVTKEFAKIDARLTPDERKGRIDIRYKTAAGKHIIIELKRYSVRIDVNVLAAQLTKYRDALTKCLATKFPNQPSNIELIAILGEPPTPQEYPERNEDILRAINARFLTYDTLVEQTLESYGDYLARDKKLSDIVELLESL